MSYPFGNYQLLRKIASGGMGQVFVARAEAGAESAEPSLVVIKRLLPHLLEDPEFVEMFLEEARLAARLRHPNVARILELGEVNGSAYIAMEYVAGEDLRRVWMLAHERKSPLPLGAVCRVVSDAATALDYAHSAEDESGRPLGLVHRDVSPQNILLGFDGTVKLIDFGVAKARNRVQHTHSGVLKGKYAYLSPEHALGEAVDARSDLFSLGTVFWEALTGKRLFKADSDLMTARLIEDCVVPPPSKVNSALPASVDAVVLRALAKDREDRYPDARAFHEAVEDFVLNNGVAAGSAHLGAVLKSLYADRQRRELEDPSQLDTLKPTDDINQVSTPSRTLFPAVELPQSPVRTSSREALPRAASREISRTSSRGVTGSGASREDSASLTQVSEVSARSLSREVSARAYSQEALRAAELERNEDTQVSLTYRQRGKRTPWKWFAAVGAGMVVLVGILFALLHARPARPGGAAAEAAALHPVTPIVLPPSPQESPKAVVVAAAAKPTLTAVPSVALTLVTTPQGAQVLVKGRSVGVTPFAFALGESAPPVAAQLVLRGFRAQDVTLSVDDAPMISVKLTPEAAPARRVKRKKTR